MARKANYKFSDKIHPVRSVISVGIGGVSMVMLLTLFILSGLHQGKGGIGIGGLGFLVFFLSIGGLTLAILSFKEKEIHYSFPVVGALVNGMLLIICLLLFIIGACI